MKKILTLVVLFITLAVNAQDKSKSKTVEVSVSGVCEMCKARIEKAAFKIKGVKSADWHVEDQMLHLIINEYKTDVLTVQKTMAAIGHDTEAVQATDEAYNSLHGCCSYERVFVVKNSCKKDCDKPCCKDKKGDKTSCCVAKGETKKSCASEKQ